MRAALLLVTVLTLATPAAAAPVARIQPGAEFSVAGDRVVYETYPADGSGVARVMSRPVSGGPARTLLRFRVDEGALGLQTAVSAQRVAVVALNREEDVSRVYVGDPDGPLRPLGETLTAGESGGRHYSYVDVDRARVFVSFFDPGRRRWRVHEADGSSRLLDERVDPAGQFAGPYAVIDVHWTGEITLLDWRTGRVVRELERTPTDFAGGPVSLRSDGDLVYPDGTRFWLAALGRAPRRLPPRSFGYWVGDRLLVGERRGRRFRVADPAGRLRVVPVPPRPAALNGDGRHLAYVKRGRLYVIALGF